MKTEKIYISITILFLMPIISFATSGACSSHGGVNCSAGASIGGKVICNDGWTNSSVYFSEADECKASSCTPPSGTGCKTENDYGALSVKLNAQGGYLGMSASQQSLLNQCRNEINSYRTDLQDYNNCLSDSSNYNTSLNNYSDYQLNNFDSYLNSEMQKYCIDEYGSKSLYISKNKACGCVSGYKFGKENQCIKVDMYCSERIGDNSYYNEPEEVCSCQSGYVLNDKNKCILGDLSCVNEFGENSWLNSTTMKCEWCEKNGVRGKKENDQCVFPVVIPFETIVPKIQQLPIVEKPIQKKVETKLEEKIEIDVPETFVVTKPVIDLPTETPKAPWYKRLFNWLFY